MKDHVQAHDEGGKKTRKSGRIDNTLRGNAMRRALSREVPKTLTPWEWEEWYEAHGIPGEFHGGKAAPEEKSVRQRGACKRFVAWLRDG